MPLSQDLDVMRKVEKCQSAWCQDRLRGSHVPENLIDRVTKDEGERKLELKMSQGRRAFGCSNTTFQGKLGNRYVLRHLRFH